MAAYSMDLRDRVLTDRDGGMSTEEVAERYHVSVSWVNRLLQRRRETGGEIGPRPQTKFRSRLLADDEQHLRGLVDAKPDQTLMELRAALKTSASVATIWRALDRLGFTFKKNGPRRRTASG
jgi:transposase